MVKAKNTRVSSPGSVYSVSSGGASEFDDEPDLESEPELELARPVKRARLSEPKRKSVKPTKDIVDIEDVGIHVARPHSAAYHVVDNIVNLQSNLLSWFEQVRERRGMPWRKRYDSNSTMDEKGQRAYEIWVSEVMLQQTQVNTVIAYWQRWIEKWPTIADLAKADIEEVNAAWREFAAPRNELMIGGLGYYRRARSLLEGAKTVMGNEKYKGEPSYTCQY
jgi:A/G-specific adenine glycosylase